MKEYDYITIYKNTLVPLLFITGAPATPQRLLITFKVTFPN